jgi:hypothetical protein
MIACNALRFWYEPHEERSRDGSFVQYSMSANADEWSRFHDRIRAILFPLAGNLQTHLDPRRMTAFLSCARLAARLNLSAPSESPLRNTALVTDASQ